MTTRARSLVTAVACAATVALVTLPTTPSAAQPAAHATTAGASAAAGASGAAYAEGLSWEVKPTGSAARFRGLSPVSRNVAWVSGSLGTVLRTTDGGATWDDVSPQGLGTEELQFRDIEARDADHAVILSIGEDEDSRILVTDDGGATWTETFRNEEPTAFYDCMAFTSAKRGVAMSDPVDGRFRLVETSDGGHSWSLVDPAGMPEAVPGEFGFAASGTCLAAAAGRSMYLVSGGVDPARVYRSEDRGARWTVQDSPVAGGAAAGIFSVSFGDDRRGVLVGGDFLVPDGAVDNAAWTADGGATWQAAEVLPRGYRSGSAWDRHHVGVVLAVGPSGSDVSADGGRTWAGFDDGSFDSVECTLDGACWASGASGRVGVLAR